MNAINKKGPVDAGYVAHFGNKTIEVYAKTSYEALQRAVEHFKPKKAVRHTVSVHLAEYSDGSANIQPTDF